MRVTAGKLIATGISAFLIIGGTAYAQQQQQEQQQQQQTKVEKDVVFVPTPQAVVDRMLEMVKVTSDDYVIDLGSGDGRIAIAAARDYGARALGIEIDPKLIAESKQNAEEAGVTDKVEFRQQDIFKTDFRDADVLTMYLLERLNAKLRPTILEELRPGTRVVSHAFHMREWEPDETANVNGRHVYMWIVPAKVSGAWSVENGDRSFTIELQQEFQEIDGNAVVDGNAVPLQDAQLRGDEISFVVDLNGERETYRGRVEDDRIVAVVEAEGAGGERGAANWQAKRTS